MSSNMAVEDALIRHQIYLIRAAGSTSEKVKSLVNELYEYTDNKLSVAKTEFTISNLTQLRSDLLILNSRIDIAEIVNQDLSELTQNEVDHLETLLTNTTSADIIKTSPEVLFNTINENNMVLSNYNGTKQVLNINEAVNSFSENAPRQISTILNFGISSGESIQSMRYSIKKLSEKSNREIDALIRTTTNHVMSEARSQVYKANQQYLEGEEYVATLDNRTTIICGVLDGQIFDVGAGPQPPLHWNCRSIRAPKIKSEFGLDGLVGDRGYVTTDKDGKIVRGITTGNTKYESWLKRQPASFQYDVLGIERAELFRSGKLSLNGFLDANYGVIPIKKLKELDNQSLAGIASKQ